MTSDGLPPEVHANLAHRVLIGPAPKPVAVFDDALWLEQLDQINQASKKFPGNPHIITSWRQHHAAHGRTDIAPVMRTFESRVDLYGFDTTWRTVLKVLMATCVALGAADLTHRAGLGSEPIMAISTIIGMASMLIPLPASLFQFTIPTYPDMPDEALQSAVTPSTAEPEPPSAEVRRQVAIERITRCLDDYATKRCDIGWFLEHQALERPTDFPETADWLEACTAVQDHDLNTVDLDWLEKASTRLQVTWKAALANADVLGFEAMGPNATKARAADEYRRRLAEGNLEPAEVRQMLAAMDKLLLACRITIPPVQRAQLETRARGQLES